MTNRRVKSGTADTAGFSDTDRQSVDEEEEMLNYPVFRIIMTLYV